MTDPVIAPNAPLSEGEDLLLSIQPDRQTYIRDHAWMAAIAMAIGMAILWAIGNPHVWTGAVGGLAAIMIRGWYIASEELSFHWDLTNRRLIGPTGGSVRLGEIKALNTLLSSVQVVTTSGSKHLLKYQADTRATKTAIERARLGGRL